MTTPAFTPGPEGLAAEQRALVGRMLVDPRSIPDTAVRLLPEDLLEPRLAVIYTSVLAVHATGAPVDAIAVGVHLHRRGQLGNVGGSSFLTALVQEAAESAEPTPPSPWFASPADVAPVVPMRGVTLARGIPAAPSEEEARLPSS